LVLEVVVLVVGLESLQEVSLLGVLPLVLNTGMRGSVALRWRGGTVHGLSFVVLVLLQVERVSSLMVVTAALFVEVALVGKMVWIVLTPLSCKWLATGFTLLVLTPVLSRLFAHVLVFEFQVGDLKNIWLIDSVAQAYDRRQGVVLKSRPGGDKEVHHFWGQWAWACAFRR
jgi:hypothetical protein